MEQGLTKYDALVTSGEYSTSDPKDAQILVLQTQVQNLEDTVTKRRQKVEKKVDKPRGGGQDDKKRKGRKSWQLVPPPTGEPTTKTVNGRTFHWCTKPHGMDAVPLWGVHEPAQHRDTFKRQRTGNNPKEGEIVQAHVASIDDSAINNETEDEGEA
jgi:hypothetical protein